MLSDRKEAMKYMTLEDLQKLMVILEKHLTWYRQNGYIK